MLASSFPRLLSAPLMARLRSRSHQKFRSHEKPCAWGTVQLPPGYEAAAASIAATKSMSAPRVIQHQRRMVLRACPSDEGLEPPLGDLCIRKDLVRIRTSRH